MPTRQRGFFAVHMSDDWPMMSPPPAPLEMGVTQ